MKKLKVADIMNRKVVSIQEDAQAQEAIGMMQKGGFRHLPVVRKDGEVVGILSDRDLRDIAVMFDKQPKDADGYMMLGPIAVSGIMARNPITVSSGDTVVNAVNVMKRGGFHALPVVDDDKLVGIVSTMDMLRLLLKLLTKP